MIAKISDYFTNLNDAGQALFVVGILLIVTFIVLLIIVLKPEKNKIKKIYGESEITDRENAFEEKMKDIDNISVNDINIDNDRTRNLKNIVDKLKYVENKHNSSLVDKIEAYEDEQEDTAIISVGELLKATNTLNSTRRVYEPVETVKKVEKDDDFLVIDEEDYKTGKITIPKEVQNTYTPKKDVFSSVYTNEKKEDNNQEFLNSLKEFRSNL